MEKKLVALVTIALLVGLGVGYIVNYVIYQPQIQYLRDSVDKLTAIADNFTDYQAALDSLSAEISNLKDIIAKQNSTAQQSSNQSTSNNQTVLPYARLELQSLTATQNGADFDVDFVIKNTGTTYTVLELIYLNSTPQQYITDLSSIVINGTTLSTTDYINLIILPGNVVMGTITLTGGGTYVSGTSVEVTFQTITLESCRGTIVLP